MPATNPMTVEPTRTKTSVSSAVVSVSTPVAISPTAMRIVTNGRVRPSFSPLSTLIALLTTAGTRGSATTACPSAASVGARITPIRPACHGIIPGNRTSAMTAPRSMVSGRPIPRSGPTTRFAGPAADIERRRVREEHQDEGGLEHGHDDLTARQVAKQQRAGDEPDRHEEDRDGDDRPLQAPRHEGVREEGAGEQRQRRDRHRSSASESARGGRPSSVDHDRRRDRNVPIGPRRAGGGGG